MRQLLLIFLGLFLNIAIHAGEITDFNPIWNTGTPSDPSAASGSGVLEGVSFTMTFSLNGGAKLFTSTSTYTSNSTLGHGGVPGTLLLGGGDSTGENGEGLTINFDQPVDVILGFSHIANSGDSVTQYDGWQFITPADEVISLEDIHELLGSISIDGFESKEALTALEADADAISYFKWNDVMTIDLATLGSTYTTIGLSSLQILPRPSAVPSLSFTGLLILISLFSLFSFFGFRNNKC